MKKIFRFSGFFFFFLLGAIFVQVDSARGFTLSPLRHTMVVDPGKTAVAQVALYNNEDHTLELVPEVDAFRIHPESGYAQFGESDVAKSWIHTDVGTITLAPGAKQIVNFTVTVPPNSLSESHYLGLFVKEKPGNGQIGIGKRLGTLLFLHVSGDVQEKMQLQDFSLIEKEGKKFFHIQTLNEGSIHLIPQGKMEFFNLFGRKVGEVSINPEERKVLPGGVWRTSIEVPKNLGSGRINSHLSLHYGLTDQVLTGSVRFWNIPWFFIFIAVGGVIIAGSLALYKKFKKV